MCLNRSMLTVIADSFYRFLSSLTHGGHLRTQSGRKLLMHVDSAGQTSWRNAANTEMTMGVPVLEAAMMNMFLIPNRSPETTRISRRATVGMVILTLAIGAIIGALIVAESEAEVQVGTATETEIGLIVGAAEVLTVGATTADGNRFIDAQALPSVSGTRSMYI